MSDPVDLAHHGPAPRPAAASIATAADLDELRQAVVSCTACPRLTAWREQVGREKRRSFQDWEYWARPVPGFGDPDARLLVLGLAPAAHGANRTGRMFTGDRSGDWLYAAMYRAGFANQPRSTDTDDGLTLIDAYVTASVRCAPPGNKPLPEERDACARFLHAELALLRKVRVILCLGKFAWDAALRTLRERGFAVPTPAPAFAHGCVAEIGALTLVGSYHPSQQNTFTGKLTEPMFDAAFAQVRARL